MVIISVDPGTYESAYVVYETDRSEIIEAGQDLNEVILVKLATKRLGVKRLVIEMIKSYGMAVGDSTFETCVWIGRFIQAWNGPVDKLPRKTVVTVLCNSPRAKDTNVRRALLDLFSPAFLKGFSRDMWSALAVAVAWDMIKNPLKFAREQAKQGQGEEFLA